jgi:hypothetical protein
MEVLTNNWHSTLRTKSQNLHPDGRWANRVRPVERNKRKFMNAQTDGALWEGIVRGHCESVR